MCQTRILLRVKRTPCSLGTGIKGKKACCLLVVKKCYGAHTTKFYNLGNQDDGTPGQWDTGTMGHWVDWTPGQWDTGTMGHRDNGTQGQWDTGTTGHCDNGTPGQWDTRTMGHQDNGWGWSADLP